MSDQEQSQLGASRTAILPPDGLRAVRRGPVQVHFVPPPESFDARQAYGELQSLGLDVEGLSPQALEGLVKIGPEILHRMAYENLSPEDFARDPGVTGDLLGDELLGLVRQLADRAAEFHSPLNPPDLDEDTRTARRRKDKFSYTVNDPQFEDEKRLLLQNIMEWGIADPANMEAFKADPGAVIRRLGADRHPAVQQSLIDFYQAK